MEEEDALAWLGRKVAWGFDEGQLDNWIALGASRVIDLLVAPDDAGAPARSDPFAGIDRDVDRLGRVMGQGIRAWIDAAITSPRPLETFMEFFWHDYFAVSFRSVRPPDLLFDHMNLLATHALGNYRDLLRSVTIDAAMLVFLDGRLNTNDRPNENYGRELLELYSVGVGEFSEDDVQAASRALTGWTVRRFDPEPRFRRQLHDSSSQTLLGVDGVNDLDTTIDAVLGHPATARRVVNKLADAFLGQGHDQRLTEELAQSFASTWEIRPVVRALLELGIDGHAAPSLVEPLPWYVTARRLATTSPTFVELRSYFSLAGQLPMRPPNVGGFPPPDAYLSTSATIARFNMASALAVATETSDGEAELHAITDDVDSLARRLGLVRGFRSLTHEAILGLRPGVDRLAAALASPDLVVV